MARVLVVEDNDINLALMQYLLTAFGHEVLSAHDGQEGLRMIREQRPDVVICDIEMPRTNGVALAAAVRADPGISTLTLLAVTSNAMIGDRERFIEAGFDGYHAKPIEAEHFVAWMEGFLPPAARSNVPPPWIPSPQSADRNSPDEPGSPPPGTGPLILALDDEPFNLSLKRSCLEPLGYRVMTATTAAEALALARKARPQLIISDVGMPTGDGFDFICEVKQDPKLRDVPFLFISATHWDDASRDKALALGALRYLRRPMPSEMLIREVQSALNN